MAEQDGQKKSRFAKTERRPIPEKPTSQQPANSTGEPSCDAPVSPVEHGESADRREQLAAEAQAAAEQAVQLAKLAQEAARLAQQLNAQALGEDASSPPESEAHAVDPAGIATPEDSDQLLPANATAHPTHAVGPLSRRQTAGRTVKHRRRPSAVVPEDKPSPRDVRIKATLEELQRHTGGSKQHSSQWTSMIISTAVHVVVLMLLGLVTFAVRSEDSINTVIASFAEDEVIVEEELPLEEPRDEPGEQQEKPTPEEPLPHTEEPDDQPPVEEPVAEPVPDESRDPAEETESAEEAPPTPGPEPDAETAVDLAKVGSRSETGKALLLGKYGGTPASESAVQRALQWLASRQRRDGSWNFNDVDPCSHAGDVDNPMGATAYVLLCYLGAGHTHQQGPFKKNVRAGLRFLLAHGKRVPAGGDFRGSNCREHDNFYVQAPVAMALSEAAQMSRDRRMGLRQAAQLAVDFLCNAQDPQGGGWRYEPREPGCTSVTVLVAMALRSASQAGLKVNPRVREGISHFLDTVRSDGAPTGRYGYRVAEPNYRSSTTAMALLCRMYQGWDKENEELQKGVAILDERGPYDNLYYCYYATQVMKHWGGEEWKRWNDVMRDDLVRTQVSREGPELGSWTPRDRSIFSTAGGRLFVTCLATMTLEVYYRYLPLYGLPGNKTSLTEGTSDAPMND